jgi:ankyrin repeat protein
VYTEAIQRIEGQLKGHRELAKRVLSWITFAKRPLTTTEICCALAVEPEETEIDPDNVPDIEDIVSVCAGLVVVDQESALIRLVHYTTQEFFERTGNELVTNSQLDITRTCLAYLCFDAFQSGSCTADKEYEKRLQEHHFLDYAAKYWGEHARAVEDDVAGQVCMFLYSTSLSCAVQVLRVPVYKSRGYSGNHPTTTPLHELAHFGLAAIAGQLASAPSGLPMSMVNARNSRGDTPLSMAAVQGHCEAVNMLLDNEADVNAQGGEYGNALQAASDGGHEAVVKMLLDKGAYVDTLGGEYSSELQVASGGGHKRVVEMLLNAGAYVNAQSGYYGTALYAASLGGHEQVVKMLLDTSADVDAPGEEGRSALFIASEGGHKQVVKLLLDAGANFGKLDQGGALSAASLSGHVQVVKLFLDAYASADINDIGGDDALYMAALEGHEEVVALLLDAGADVNVRVGIHGNALQAALSRGHEQIVKLLHEAGAI